MKNSLNSIIITSLLFISVIACGGTKAPRKNIKLFPSEEACNYPSNSSITKFHSLGGGGPWRHLVVGGADLGYDCGKSEKEMSFVPLASSDTAGVEYGVVGTVDGAKSVHFDYDIFVTAPIPNESTFRKEFLVLLDEVTRQALKQPLPESAQNKILDLSTFANLGVMNEEIVVIGDGQMTLSRNRNSTNTSILIKVGFCPDKNIPCE
jgi:hypothetical protein